MSSNLHDAVKSFATCFVFFTIYQIFVEIISSIYIYCHRNGFVFPSPRPRLQFVYDSPDPNLNLAAPFLNFYLPASVLKLYLPSLGN